MIKHRLLLADDSVTIQKVVNLTFADEGIEVVAVGDGDAAMQKFVEAVPDLVMVDVNMPGMDGYQICEMIKQDDETKHIPVILLVGSFEPFDETEARRVGADDFLTKPFQSIRQLVNKVSDLLNGKSGNLTDDKFADSFENTLEMPPPSDLRTRNFGDTALDDEMIQTDQIGSLPINEAQKLQSVPELKNSTENYDSNFETEAATVERVEIPATENLPELESSSENSRLVDDEPVPDETFEDPLPRHENIYDFADRQETEPDRDENFEDEKSAESSETQEADSDLHTADETFEVEPIAVQSEARVQENLIEENFVSETSSNQTETDEAPTKYEATQEFELDDFDLLELPQSKKSKSSKTVLSDVKPTGSLSPEDIEAVADKVVEKISDKVIKQIVREVFTQMTKKK